MERGQWTWTEGLGSRYLGVTVSQRTERDQGLIAVAPPFGACSLPRPSSLPLRLLLACPLAAWLTLQMCG